MDNRSIQKIEAEAFEEGFNAGIREEQKKYIEAIRTMSDHIKELEDKHWEESRQIALYDDELKQAKNGWISIEDRLPETSDDVLIYFENIVEEYGMIARHMGTGAYVNGHWHSDNLHHFGGTVLYWMPLPECPKEIWK